jgi:endonuclease-3 related protein
MPPLPPPFVAPRRLGFRRFVAALLAAYGEQGWWPLRAFAGRNPTSTGRFTGYHPGDYRWPRTAAQRFEIACGAILTQNTAWPNVERALENLAGAGWLSPEALLSVPVPKVEGAIRPSGYFRAKTLKLRHFSAFFLRLDGRVPTRDELLSVWGIGPETADSIRLYAYAQLEMVVDAYTRRVLSREGYWAEPLDYAATKRFCAARVERTVPAYQEFHALMVEHGKRLGARPPR